MEFTIAALVMLSAALHPARDALIRSTPKPSTAYLGIVITVLTFSLGHVLLVGGNFADVFKVLHILAISQVAMVTYSFLIVQTYSRGDLSIYYPITRSSPLFIVVVGVTVLGETYAWSTVFGILLVVIGGYMIQRKPGIRPTYELKTTAFALIAMAAHGLGAICDGYAIKLIDPEVWFFWNWMLMIPWLILLFRFVTPANGEWPPFNQWRQMPLRLITGGAALYASYFIILITYTMGGSVAAIAAVRLASIPFAVIIGGGLLSEEAMARRLLYSLVIGVGIAIIVFSK